MESLLEKRAERDLARLDAATRQRILAVIAAYASGEASNARKLGGFKNRYRLRVGGFRVVFDLDDSSGRRVMRVIAVVDRKDAYR